MIIFLSNYKKHSTCYHKCGKIKTDKDLGLLPIIHRAVVDIKTEVLTKIASKDGISIKLLYYVSEDCEELYLSEGEIINSNKRIHWHSNATLVIRYSVSY